MCSPHEICSPAAFLLRYPLTRAPWVDGNYFAVDQVGGWRAQRFAYVLSLIFAV